LNNTIQKEFLGHLETIQKVIETMEEPLQKAANLAVETLKNGNKVILFDYSICLIMNNELRNE